MLVSASLCGNTSFRQTLAGAGISVFTANTETEALRAALQRDPGVVVIEFSGDPVADDLMLSFADHYSRSHDAAVLLFGKGAAPANQFPGPRTGSIRWVDHNDCGPDFLAHIVVDAAGCLSEFDSECQRRFGSEKSRRHLG